MNIKNLKTTTFALLLAAGVQSACTTTADTASSAPLQSIPTLDVARYMGTWHEIAKYPNRFQQQCVSNTQAEYSLQGAGRVQVINRCQTSDGSVAEAVGTARQVGPADSSQLKVRFAPAWLSWLPMVWGDYWVIDLDPAYQLVAVSEPRREYLWVLSRTPAVDEQAYRRLLARLEARGFDVQRLERSPQDADEQVSPE
ncbi:lipocalin family protein [Thauera sp.]|uniref:lipocalin family protein n=1 Tax=Thauera sp. TaxID=1905334 RepID=UPI002B96A7D0|nr:lipocalin family protein [Thauera sp.]HRP25550.1 lipocalin family protein [Thauera sp.]